MSFKNYAISELSYKKNSNFKKNKEKQISINNNFHSTIYFSDKEFKGCIEISTKLGNLNDEESAFEINADFVGIFEFQCDSNQEKVPNHDEVEEMKKMLALNGNAIMYPYLRSNVADISLRSNQFPAYILPTMNFVELLDSEKGISFQKLD